MEYGRVDRVQAGVAAIAALALAATLLPVRNAEASVAFVDPLLREELVAGGLQPAILVLEPHKVDAALGGLRRLHLEHHLLSELGMASVILDASTLEAVAALPGVATVYRNEHMHPLLDRSADYVGAKAVWHTYGVTGKGVTVVVMDSGIDGKHPDLPFGNKVVENVVPTRQGSGLVAGSKEGVVSSDGDGHGTHVAGIIGGTGAGSGGRFRGVAPGARLVGYQAGLPDGRSGDIEFESLTVLEGFNWALANRARLSLDIVSNSWGANGDFDAKSPVNIATLNLYKAGILVLFAAGNEGNEGTHTLNKYSVAPWVLSVTAGDYFNQVPAFASRGTDAVASREPFDHPDVVAPGVSITSTRSLKSSLSASPESSLYATKSGSSMATPHVAGVAALLLEANPRLSPDDLMDLLTATATPLPRTAVWEAGAGYVNALKAHQLATKAIGHRDTFLSGKVKYAGPASGDLAYAKDAVSVGYQRGHASTLRSPDTSIPSFFRDLFATPRGLIFLVGATTLGALAFGRRETPAPQATRKPAAQPAKPSHPWIESPGVAPPMGPRLGKPSVFSGPPPRPVRGVVAADRSSARMPRIESPRR